MIKKVVHISDIHIRTFKRHSEYEEILSDVLTSIKEEISPHTRDEVRILIVGDLVHQKITISNEQLLLLAWFLQECTKIAPTVVVAGNHDLLENNKDRMDSLTPIIKLLGNLEIDYLKESKCYEDENIVWCNYSIFEENTRPDIEKARIDNPYSKFVGLLHAPVIGSKTNLGYEFSNGVEVEYFDGLDCVMLGDIHCFQKIDHPTIPIYYPSSTIQQDYGESVSNHGYILWDIDTMTNKFVNISSEYGFYKFKIKSLADIDNGTEILVNK